MRMRITFVPMKEKVINDNKKPKNLSFRPSVVKIAEDKAKKMARKKNITFISMSEFLETIIKEYNG